MVPPFPNSLPLVSNDSDRSQSDLQDHLPTNNHIPLPSNKFISQYPQESTIHDYINYAEPHGVQLKHAKGCHLCPYFTWRAQFIALTHQTKHTKSCPSVETFTNQDHTWHLNGSDHQDLPNTSWHQGISPGTHSTTTMDTPMVDSQPKGVPSQNWRQNHTSTTLGDTTNLTQ